MFKPKKQSYKKIALVLSLCALILWAFLGTGASLAWFTDTTPELKNVFNFAEFDLEVLYLTEDGNWKTVESDTEIFSSEDLYEPGFTKVVYLKVINKGSVPFHYQTAVIPGSGSTPGINVFSQSFQLHEYLRFGLVAPSENDTYDLAEVQALLDTREKAAAVAVNPLNRYDSTVASLAGESETCMAMVIRMPEEVGNVANYLTVQPRVELGISVNATQKK